MVSDTERETFALESTFLILLWQTFQITEGLAIVTSKESRQNTSEEMKRSIT